jgi:hypothetical protein
MEAHVLCKSQFFIKKHLNRQTLHFLQGSIPTLVPHLHSLQDFFLSFFIKINIFNLNMN